MKTGMPLREAAALLGVDRRTLYRWAGQGGLNRRIVNGSAMIKTKELGHLLEIKTGKNKEPSIMEEMENIGIGGILQQLVAGSDKLLPVSEVARLLRVSKSLIYDRINSGQLKAVKVGMGGSRTSLRVLQSSLEGLLRDDY